MVAIELKPAMSGDAVGGQLMQVALGGINIFYQAPSLLHVAGGPRRGGVPVLFPQFNQVGSFAKHGFARTQLWQVLASSADAWVAELLASTERITPDLPITSAPWPHNATLTLSATTTQNTVEVLLRVKNIGASEFSFTGGLHPYFAWGEGDAHIPELGISLIREQMMKSGKAIEERVGTAGQLTLAMRNYKLVIRRIGFNEWMLWNPGGEHTLTDIAKDDWQRFICLEPVSIDQPHLLAPGQTFEGGFALSVEAIQ